MEVEKLRYRRIHEWFKRFQEGREALEDDERSGRPRNVVNEENTEIVREFIRKEPKSSLKYIESELRISAASIYSILTENLGYIKVFAKFITHTSQPHEKDLRIQHSSDIIKEAKKNRNFLYSILTGDETWCFQYEPETNHLSSKWQPREKKKKKKTRQEKSKIKSMMICFYDSKGTIHKEFVPTGQTVNAVFNVGVLKRLISHIRRIRPEYREEGIWRLLHDNAASHRSTLATDYLNKNRIVTINHSSYSPDMAPSDFYLFGKLHLAMKGKRYADVDAIAKAFGRHTQRHTEG